MSWSPTIHSAFRTAVGWSAWLELLEFGPRRGARSTGACRRLPPETTSFQLCARWPQPSISRTNALNGSSDAAEKVADKKSGTQNGEILRKLPKSAGVGVLAAVATGKVDSFNRTL